MIRFLQRRLGQASTDTDLGHRTFLLNMVLLGLAGPGLAFGVAMAALWALGLAPSIGVIAGLGVQPFYLIAYLVGRRGRVTEASHILSSVVFLAMVASMVQVGIGHVSIIGLAMVVVTAGVLISARAASLYLLLGVVAYLGIGAFEYYGYLPTTLLPVSTIIVDTIGLGLGLSVIVIVNWLHERQMHRSLQTQRSVSQQLHRQSIDLEKRVAERTRILQRQTNLLDTTATIAKMAIERVSLKELMSRAIDIIGERFGFYQVSIYLIDETGTLLNLAASSGEVGRQLVDRNYRLSVGSPSIVGWVGANQKPRAAPDTSKDPMYFRMSVLPDTRSEVAAPMKLGQRLIGVLDLQANEPRSFDDKDVATIQTIANELAIALENSRLIHQSQQELERFKAEYRSEARASWGRLPRAGTVPRVYLTPDGEQIQSDEKRMPSMQEAIRTGETAFAEDEDEVAVPILVRGEVIATIGARKRGKGEKWSEEDIALLEAVAGQAGLSLETARQYTEEQRRVSELEAINRVSQAASQLRRAAALFRVVHTQINQVMGQTDLLIAMHNSESDQIDFAYAHEGNKKVDLPSIPIGKDLISRVLTTGQTLILVEDASQQAKELGVQIVGKPICSWVGVPMVVGDKVLGVIAIQDREEKHRFTDDDAAFLTTIASQVATAFENYKLLEQVQLAARRERMIREITTKIRRSPDIGMVLETTARELRRALGASRTNITLDHAPESDQTYRPSTSLEPPNQEPEEASPEEGRQ